MSDCLFCASQNRFGWPAQPVTASENLHIECEALKAEVDRQFPEKNFDIRLGREQLRIPERLTYQNMSISGVARTGKTQVVNSLLQQLRTMANQKCLIFDINGYYYSRFGQPGDKVLSVNNHQSEVWDFWNENVHLELFAETLVEVDQCNKFFSKAGRALVTDLIKLNNSIEGLWRDLTSSLDQLLERIEGKSSSALLQSPQQAATVRAMAILELDFLKHFTSGNQEREPFSLTRWATRPSNEWVFLIVRAEDLAEYRPLLKLWFELAILGLFQRYGRSNEPHLWLIADELPALGKIPSLEKLLVQTRPCKASVVASYQVSTQLRFIYGRAGAEAIIQSFENKIHFRNPEPSAAIELGFPAREIQSLPDLQAYLKICRFAPTRIQLDTWSSQT